MGTRLQVTDLKTNKKTEDCGKFYSYCDYENAKESFNFLIELYKQGKFSFDDDGFIDDHVNEGEYEEAFNMFALGPYFGDITLSNEDFIKFINLHNKEAWKFWERENMITKDNAYENWYFKIQCDELAKLPGDKCIFWS